MSYSKTSVYLSINSSWKALKSSVNQVMIISLFIAYIIQTTIITYSFSSLILFFQHIKYAFKVVFLVLHGFQDEFEQFLINVLDYAVELGHIGVRICQHNLNNLRELLLEDLLNKFSRGAFRDGLCWLPFISQLLLLSGEIGDIVIFLSLPGHIIVEEMLDKLSQPKESFSFA